MLMAYISLYFCGLIWFIVKVRQQRSRISAYVICLTEAFPPLMPGEGLEC